RFKRLQAEAAEVQVRAALGGAVDAALELLAELCALWLQHCSSPKFLWFSGVLATALVTAAMLLALDRAALGRHGVVLKDLALEHPDLDATNAVGGLRFGGAVIDVGAQRVQRHPALTVPFHARDLGTAETAGAVDADALGTEAHRRLHGALHGAAERDAALQLLGDRLRDQLGVGLGLAHLDDVQVRLRPGHLGQLAAQLLDVGALLADDQARTRSVNGDAALLVRALDHDLRDGGLLQLLLEILADLQVLVQQLAVLAGVGVPARVPGAVDAETQADRIDFLTHYAASTSSTSRTTMVRCENGFSMREARPRPRAMNRF